ncbi:3-oxoacyl-[acyl-carrier-protein] reductase [Anaerobranca californiensis DSM 14826]|uniref:3-oxoacyl-[acyl-carrier-protein] reductase n=1 Tax=Anaerobranca californiensis DSM 14826 TaxID=1120989 RepID=A0A1M6MGZ8_9FIRM|nr:3-oxoacyl-[acyl-carrier-protein] reductase [Anaerobranca californiensis]SHJ82725.1 3-oxoacyl-[acyl-carrier-protein] reductase [Anaerobranca californiensis DSM 14826]
MKLKGKVAVVTGASRGIGKAIALKLAEEGAKVVVNYNSSEEEAQKVVNAILEIGGEGIAVKGNIADYNQSQQLIEKTLEEFQRVDILVNNAGITRDNLLLRMSEEDFDQVIDVNLKGYFNCTKAVIRPMLKNKKGKIINITSVIGITGNTGQSNYAAAKAGVIGFTKSLAKELGGKGINVNAVAPGFIQTDMTDKLPEEIKRKIGENIPLKTFGKPEDVAKLVVFLASSDSDYITGQIIGVDGGLAL